MTNKNDRLILSISNFSSLETQLNTNVSFFKYQNNQHKIRYFGNKSLKVKLN